MAELAKATALPRVIEKLPFFLGAPLTVPPDPLHISLMTKEAMDSFKLGAGILTKSQMSTLIEPLKNATILALPEKIMKIGKKGLGMVGCSEKDALNAFADFTQPGVALKQRITFSKCLKEMGGDTPANRMMLVHKMGQLALQEMQKRIAIVQEKEAAAKAEQEATGTAEAQTKFNENSEEKESAYQAPLDVMVARAKAKAINQANRDRGIAIAAAKKAVPKGDLVALNAINNVLRAVAAVTKACNT